MHVVSHSFDCCLMLSLLSSPCFLRSLSQRGASHHADLALSRWACHKTFATPLGHSFYNGWLRYIYTLHHAKEVGSSRSVGQLTSTLCVYVQCQSWSRSRLWRVKTWHNVLRNAAVQSCSFIVHNWFGTACRTAALGLAFINEVYCSSFSQQVWIEQCHLFHCVPWGYTCNNTAFMENCSHFKTIHHNVMCYLTNTATLESQHIDPQRCYTVLQWLPAVAGAPVRFYAWKM